MAVELRRFEMYYFSEVHADILYRYQPEYETYKITATHPRTSTSFIDNWFHFSDERVEAREDPLPFESEDPVEPLALMADKLSSGPAHILKKYDVHDPERQFFTDFICALANGDYNVNDGRPVHFEHEAGGWLLNQAEKYKNRSRRDRKI